MHQRVLAERAANAQAKIETAAQALAAEGGVTVPPGLTATQRDPAVQALIRLEAVAELLTQLAPKATLTQPLPRGEGEAELTEAPKAKRQK